jgi:hypothetical protein
MAGQAAGTRARRQHARVRRLPGLVAQGIVSTLEGAMLVAPSYGELKRFNATARQLLGNLSS